MLFRRFRILSCIALIAWLIPSPAHAERCDERCAAYVQAEVKLWNDARQVTLERMWFGFIAANHPHQVCVKAHESVHAGLYRAYDGSGNFGAYQDDQTTWDASAVRAGRSDLVGVRPDLALWYDQEQVNWRLYMDRGDQPWGNRC